MALLRNPKVDKLRNELQYGSSRAVNVVLQFLLAVDALIQRAATSILPVQQSKGRPYSVRRNIHRGIFIFLCTAIYLTTRNLRNNHFDRVNAIPILGPHSYPNALYYPPVGNDFRPAVASYNLPPHNRPRTPLFIPFSRNNTMLRQAVLSYISSGWPRADIVIIDNSGTFDANPHRQLTDENPFFLDYNLYRKRYGVSVLQTPTYLTFAQLQNFLTRMAVAKNWSYYFWSHMDIAVLGDEEKRPYRSFYKRVLDTLYDSGVESLIYSSTGQEESAKEDYVPETPLEPPKDGKVEMKATSKSKRGHFGDLMPGGAKKHMWSHKFFFFDYLTLVNVPAQRVIGPWDVWIPFYHTDCDYYARSKMLGYRRDQVYAGPIYDVASAIWDPENRFFPATEEAGGKLGMWPDDKGVGDVEPPGGRLASWRYKWLKEQLVGLQDDKNENEHGRNTWQAASVGVPGFNDQKKNVNKNTKRLDEPWSYDPRGFQAAWWATSDDGRQMYVRKWGTLECELVEHNKTMSDEWLSEYLEDDSTELQKLRDEQYEWGKLLAEEPIR